MHRMYAFGWVLCAGLLFAAPPDADRSRGQAALARLPLRFEENHGQAPGDTRFLAHAEGFRLELTAHGPAMAVGSRRVDLRLVGSNPAPAIEGEKRMAAPTNYFVGRREHWVTGVTNYGQVRYRAVYPGIDAVYYGNQNQLEYDFVVAPGADPGAIRLQFRGADRVRVTHEGDLSVEAGGQPILQKRPRVYQDGREVAAHYQVDEHGQASIELGNYDRSRELVIDPILMYCTYLGTSGNDQVTSDQDGAEGPVVHHGFDHHRRVPVHRRRV